jgi:tetratricopeptide (TPR) repeat protein
MDVDRSRVRLELYQTPAADVIASSFDPTLNRSYALGVYDNDGERIVIWLESTNLTDVEAVIRTLAHELGHVHLLGDGRLNQSNPDHEPLTDLLTVFMGCGIFSANRALTETNWKAGRWSGWSISTGGYLSMAQYSYALALYARARRERSPSWVKYLRPDVRAMMQTELARLGNSLRQESLTFDPVQSLEDGSSSKDKVEELAPHQADGQVDESEDEAVPVDADDPFALGTLCAAENDHEAAVQAFTKSLELHPHDAEVWLSRANSYLSLKQCANAIEDCTKAIHYGPREAWAYCRRAEGYFRLRQYQDAITDLDQVRKLDHLIAMQYLLSGLAHFGLGAHDRALAELNQAIRYAPTWAENYLARGRVYEAMGKDRLSQADFAKAVHREPRFNDPVMRASSISSVPL